MLTAKRLDSTDEVGILAARLVGGGLVPDKAASDAIHIAVASVHRMDYLVTWNFKHIANPLIRDRMRKAVSDFGYHLPVMCNPDELLLNHENNRPPLIQPDEVITEVRRTKVALAAKHNFDVMAMVRSLQERERNEKREPQR